MDFSVGNISASLVMDADQTFKEVQSLMEGLSFISNCTTGTCASPSCGRTSKANSALADSSFSAFSDGAGQVDDYKGRPFARDQRNVRIQPSSEKHPAVGVDGLTKPTDSNEQPAHGPVNCDQAVTDHNTTPGYKITHTDDSKLITPAQDPPRRQLWPSPAERMSNASETLTPAACLAPQSASPAPSASLNTSSTASSIASVSSTENSIPALTPLSDVTQAELGRLLQHTNDLRQRLHAAAGANQATARDLHTVWQQLQSAQAEVHRRDAHIAELQEHKALLLQYLKSSDGADSDSREAKFALETLRGTALQSARRQLDSTRAELLHARQRQQALERLAARQAAVHEAERAALLKQLKALSDQAAHYTFVRRDEARTAAAKQAQAERRQAGLEADLKATLARAAQAEKFSKEAADDLRSMQDRIEAKNASLDELSRELRVTNEALGIVKGALSTRSQELMAARSRCEELQRTIDATGSGDVANLVSSSSQAAGLVQVRYEAECARLRREVARLREQLRDAHMKHSAVVSSAQATLRDSQSAVAAAAAKANRSRPLALSPTIQCGAVQPQAEPAKTGGIEADASCQTPPSVPLISSSCQTETVSAAAPVARKQGVLVDSGAIQVFHMNSEHSSSPEQATQSMDSFAQTDACERVTRGVSAEPPPPTLTSSSTQTNETQSTTAAVHEELLASHSQCEELRRQLSRAAAVVQAVEVQLDEAEADAAEAKRAQARAERNARGAEAERERAAELAMDLAVEVASTTANEERWRAQAQRQEAHLRAARAQEVMLRLAWAALVRKAGAVATAASAEVTRLTGELQYAQQVNASLVSEHPPPEYSASPPREEAGGKARTLALSHARAESAAGGTPLRSSSRGGAGGVIPPPADDWVAVSNMLDQVSIDDSDSDSSVDEASFKPSSIFDAPSTPVSAQQLHEGGGPAVAGGGQQHLADSTDSAWQRALGHANSVASRNAAMQQQLQALQALSRRAGLSFTPPRQTSAEPQHSADGSADSSWHTAGALGDDADHTPPAAE